MFQVTATKGSEVLRGKFTSLDELQHVWKEAKNEGFCLKIRGPEGEMLGKERDSGEILFLYIWQIQAQMTVKKEEVLFIKKNPITIWCCRNCSGTSSHKATLDHSWDCHTPSPFPKVV